MTWRLKYVINEKNSIKLKQATSNNKYDYLAANSIYDPKIYYKRMFARVNINGCSLNIGFTKMQNAR